MVLIKENKMTEEQLVEIKTLQDELICKGGPKKGQPKSGADPVKLVRLKELLDEQRAEAGEAEPVTAPEPVLDEPKKEKKIRLAAPPKKTRQAAKDEVALEREIRRYVKKDGGYRKDMSKEAINEANRLLKIAGRTVDDGWDQAIAVPGMRC
jgi:hypothetical protein